MSQDERGGTRGVPTAWALRTGVAWNRYQAGTGLLETCKEGARYRRTWETATERLPHHSFMAHQQDHQFHLGVKLKKRRKKRRKERRKKRRKRKGKVNEKKTKNPFPAAHKKKKKKRKRLRRVLHTLLRNGAQKRTFKQRENLYGAPYWSYQRPVLYLLTCPAYNIIKDLSRNLQAFKLSLKAF